MKSEKNKKIMKFSQINTCLQNNLLEYLDTSEVEPMEMYRDIFSTMELETKGQQEQGKYNLICIQIGYDKDNNKKGVRRFFIHNGLKELDTLIRSKTNDFCMLSCISYAGLQNNHNNARYMYALVLDLDDILISEKNNGLDLIDIVCGKSKNRPTPNYIVSSGHGLHLYFLFDKPVAMYKNSQVLLFELKKELVKMFWVEGEVSASKEQHGNIIQCFRIAGTKTKDKKHIVKCFKVSDTKKYTPYELANFTHLKNKKDYTTMTKKSNYTLEQCKKNFPEWYERRIVKKLPPKKWHIKRDLYDWFKRKILEKPSFEIIGHRYYCCMCLVVYAIKCDIDYEELKKDLYELQPILNENSPKNQQFTMQDIKDALQVYSDNVNIYTRARMELLSGIAMPPNKRNGMTQQEHIEFMNFRRKQKIKNGSCDMGIKREKYKNDIFNFINTIYDEFLETEKESVNIKLKDIIKNCDVSINTASKYFRQWRNENLTKEK